MAKITLDEAAHRTLMDVVTQACAQKETVVVTGPNGEVARVVPAGIPSPVSPARTWKGRAVYDAEQLAKMSPEELKAIGWTYPDESAWVDEVTSASGGPEGTAE